MSITEMLDNVPDLEEGMVPVFKNWERTAIPLKKYFHDVSVFLSVNRIQDLFKMGSGIKINKDRNGIKFSLDYSTIDPRYFLTRAPDWLIFQNNKNIPMPKPEITISPAKEKIGKKPEKVESPDLTSKVSEIESTILRMGNQIMSKGELTELIKTVIKDLQSTY